MLKLGRHSKHLVLRVLTALLRCKFEVLKSLFQVNFFNPLSGFQQGPIGELCWCVSFFSSHQVVPSCLSRILANSATVLVHRPELEHRFGIAMSCSLGVIFCCFFERLLDVFSTSRVNVPKVTWSTFVAFIRSESKPAHCFFVALRAAVSMVAH